jgi:hypothetical protein
MPRDFGVDNIAELLAEEARVEGGKLANAEYLAGKIAEEVARLTVFAKLRPDAKEMMMQLFLHGPTWDGNVVSKCGRGQLFDLRLADRVEGWTFLTRLGVAVATEADVRGWADQRWHKKQTCQ